MKVDVNGILKDSECERQLCTRGYEIAAPLGQKMTKFTFTQQNKEFQTIQEIDFTPLLHKRVDGFE